MAEEKKKEVRNINWREIVLDAKVMKHVDVDWDDETIRIYYKELVGAEGLDIENKYPNNVAKVFYEKTYLMIMKANPDIDDVNARISKNDWDQLSERLRNAIVQKVWRLEELMQENFRNTPELK